MRLKSGSGSVLLVFSLWILMVFALFLGRTYNAVNGRGETPAQNICVAVTISPGATLQEVAGLLSDTGVIPSADEFVFVAEFLHLDQRIQAGDYVLPYGESNRRLLSRLTDAGAEARLVTVPEGYTSRQIAALLHRAIGLDSAAFITAVQDTSLLKKYGIEAPSFEGFLFPDSYHFTRNMTPTWVIDMMVRRFFEVFDESLRQRASKLGFSLTEAVTLASIIEGEMRIPSEAGRISAVYHNRLKRGMRLQADPTIQYIIKNGPRRLYNGDLAIKSPYNTYLYAGLPPGPVCNPGKTALKAALYPAEEPYLYMVARGDGSHAFNVDFKNHLQDKARLDSIRIAVEKQRRKR